VGLMAVIREKPPRLSATARCLEFAQELKDKQRRGGGQGSQIVDLRDAVGCRRCVDQKRDATLTRGFSFRDDGIGDRLESSRSKFDCDNSSGSMYGPAFGIVTLL
jgi:hypothetical protein